MFPPVYQGFIAILCHQKECAVEVQGIPYWKQIDRLTDASRRNIAPGLPVEVLHLLHCQSKQIAPYIGTDKLKSFYRMSERVLTVGQTECGIVPSQEVFSHIAETLPCVKDFPAGTVYGFIDYPARIGVEHRHSEHIRSAIPLVAGIKVHDSVASLSNISGPECITT
jgi:hypothetical protein